MSPDRILREVVSLPTAPFHEERVAAWILRFADKRGIPARMDGAGNVVLSVWEGGAAPDRLRRGQQRRGQKAPPTALAFVAHMDHPGFEARRARGAVADLEIHGGAPRACAGARVRLYGQEVGPGAPATIDGPERTRGGARWVSVRCRRGLRTPIGRDREVAPTPAFAMWDLPAFRRVGHRVYARVIDDLAGCAAILAALGRLWEGASAPDRGRPRPDAAQSPIAPVLACFTRAEEVGFVGATALAMSGLISRDAVVVSVEMSRMLPGAEQGKGPVVRVGDLRSIFAPDATQALADVAASLAARKNGFRFQKRILDGGTCEATAFRALGYRATGLACPLGNYHNHVWEGPMGAGASAKAASGPDRPGRVAPEFIDIRDWRNLVELIVAAARELPGALVAQGRIRQRVLALYDAHQGRL